MPFVAPSPIREITIKPRDFKTLCNLVHDLAGIKLHEGKEGLVRARLSKRMRILGIYDLGDYLHYVEVDSSQTELMTMVNALSTNFTSFFREKSHFDFLKNTILPQIVSRAARAGHYSLRAWSAGCATGEEPYSLAIILRESLPTWRLLDPKILATDISTRALEIAKAGIYSQERIQPVPPSLRQRHFELDGDDGRKFFTVNDKLKSCVSFQRLNLMEPWAIRGPFDFIFCRNTMIYFDKPTQERLVNRFYDYLRNEGYLIIGHSESLTGITHRFEYEKPTIYRKT
ncbi:MAG: protein-glutamate O-methyltransferase [bacterium]